MADHFARLTPVPTVAERKKENRELPHVIEACKSGERQAQQQLYQQFYNSLFAICLRYSTDQDQAKSLVNQAFLKAFQSLHQCQDYQAFPAWINRIAVNTCIDHVRKAKKRRTVAIEDAAEVAIPSSVLDKIAAEDLLSMLQQLAPMTRAVFSLYVVEGFKHAEIAEQLGMSEGTSRWHLSTAKQELKRLLQNYHHR
ncbi:MAG: RNA polymerase sigma factor [Phaeodactylibacter sp.]|nr:RNA polymerase sigma factor [Phaeodactylibacter sp.]MCB9291600.1 RNA polymerase sigma factor [Lewinellaceae bacterium]MCO6488902.1 RNA polymerase sigma factor [Phaeodactylibacter sp.]